jgi:hypothetical protein|tara:strand:- start:3987 stop:4460 length:474 start_codon:yes stop_codon:yes gene_type:complete
MAGISHTINSDTSELAFIQWVKELRIKHKYITFDYPKIGAERSLSSNALSHVWYAFADKMLDSHESGDARRYCKLHFGVPMLRGESSQYLQDYNKYLMNFDYEDKIRIMDYWPVTKRMSREQMNRYLTSVQYYFASEHHLVLESRGEFKAAQDKNNK